MVAASSLVADDRRSAELRAVLDTLLGEPVGPIDWIGGGGNSQVYRIRCGTAWYAAKVYFADQERARGRLDVEFSALGYLWHSGVRAIPRPVAADPAHRCAVYEWIEGSPVVPDEISQADVDGAVEFLAILKAIAATPSPTAIGDAADACFSAEALFANIDARVERFEGVDTSGSGGADAGHFLRCEFAPVFERMRARCAKHHADFGSHSAAPVPRSERTLSPSDFGFHNAVRRPDGRIVFVDFEYFGWDDAAKTVADFLLHPHPAMALSGNHKRRFAHGMLRTFREAPALRGRLDLVYPLYGLKWCLILLNEFLPEHLSRRRFAQRLGADSQAVHHAQLVKARSLLDRIDQYDGFPY